MAPGALKMPPPSASPPLPPWGAIELPLVPAMPTAWLSEIKSSLRVRMPLLKMPPPSLLPSFVPSPTVWPDSMFRPEMDTTAPRSILNTRLRLAALTPSWSAPRPTMFRLLLISSCPVKRIMNRPCRDGSKLMVSPSAAWAIS